MMGRRVACDTRWRSLIFQSVLFSSRAGACIGTGETVTAFLSGPYPSNRQTCTPYSPSACRMFSTGQGQHRTQDDWDLILRFEDGSHNSAKIVIPALQETSGDDAFQKGSFGQRLNATIAACREMKKSSLWVQVPMSRASLIEEMVETGLRFHNAEGDTANLCLWLDHDKDNKIPEFATHHVGVGSFVVNSRDEILCVRELEKNYMPWKIPGGLTELGEHLDEAAVREVLEETGVPCRFLSVLCVRHTHGIQFGRSDLYFVCRLEPIEDRDQDGEPVIPDPVAQAGEIETAAWVPLEEYKAMISAPGGHPMMKHIMKLFEQDWGDNDIQKTVVNSIVPGRKPSPIYHVPLREPSEDT